jgi:hydroxypyruvate isomerase
MDALIGWTGLIGQELLLQLNDTVDIYNSSNIEEIKNKSYNKIYFCGLPAEKWLINKNPENDLQNLERIKDILITVKCQKIILISTIDVLDCSIPQDEDGIHYSTHPYGIHRRMMEKWTMDVYAKNTEDSYYIIRLPGLFGKGLKKNIIYDLIFEKQIENICLDSEFQWYNISNILADINHAIENDIRLIHLFSEPVSVKDIIQLYFPQSMSKCIGKNVIKYNLQTKYGKNNYWKTKNDIILDIGKYVAYEKKLKELTAYSAVSNIAWNLNNHKDISKILVRYRIKNLEIALTKYGRWEELKTSTIGNIVDLNFNYISCQSILFNTPIKIFDNPDGFVKHYELVTELCSSLNIKRVVFGSPNQRHPGDIDPDVLIKYFNQIGDISSKYGIVFCIEPNSKKYGCTWLTNVKETVEYIKKINHLSIKLNFDLGNYIMENDFISIDNDFIYELGHIQISNEYLEPIYTLKDEYYKIYSEILQKIFQVYHYRGYISLEIKETSAQKLLKSIDKFVDIIGSY